jgi:hypothetical protein
MKIKGVIADRYLPALQAIIFKLYLSMAQDYDLESEIICLHLKADDGNLEEVEYPSHYYAEIDFSRQICAIVCLR